MSRFVRISNEDGTYTEIQVYDKVDLESFANFIIDLQLKYAKGEEIKKWDTFDELVEHWEIWKIEKGWKDLENSGLDKPLKI